jgi:D-alanine-D-alanine ligase
MRVGITFDLKADYLAMGFDKESCAEFDSIETINAIDDVLKTRGYQTERIGNLFALMKALQEGKRWDFVFNICEGMHGRGREAQVPALLDAFQIPYIFSDTLLLALTLDKALTKRVVRDAGVPTADFFEVSGVRCQVSEKFETRNLKPETFCFPLFVKPNCEGTGKGITARSLVHSEKELKLAIDDIHIRFAQSALVETYLSGREFTVGISGTADAATVIGVMEIRLNERADAAGYTFDNKQDYENRVSYHLVSDAEAQKAAQVALAAWNVLGCRDGGRIDIRSNDKGEPHFLEVNPLAGLHPVLGDLVILSKMAGLKYTDLLHRFIDSALARHALPSAHIKPNKKASG